MATIAVGDHKLEGRIRLGISGSGGSEPEQHIIDKDASQHMRMLTPLYIIIPVTVDARQFY
jgi:hypothetical protein